MAPIKLKQKLADYKTLSDGFVASEKNTKKTDTSWMTKALLIGVLPSLGSISTLQAQCINSTPLNSAAVPDNSNAGILLDIDGGGPDFRFVETASNEATLYIQGIGGAKVLGYYLGSTFSNTVTVNNYAYCAVIDTATGSNATKTNGFLFAGGLSAWGTGVGSTSGYVAIEKGGSFGFIQLTVTVQLSVPQGPLDLYDFFVTVGPMTGFQDPGTTGNVKAGVCSTLPVELTYFNAEPDRNSIHLNWQTASEMNNAGFEVERSTDGRNFKKMTFVEGYGNTNLEQIYQVEDKKVQQGMTYYYRLKQVNYDGRFEYSEIINAHLKSDISIGEIFPNPTKTGKFQLNFHTSSNDIWNISLFDTNGQKLYSEQREIANGSSVQQFDLNHLSAGVYFLKSEDSLGLSIYRKVIIN